jgi:hypothetical protein
MIEVTGLESKVCSEIKMFGYSNHDWLVEILTETGTFYSGSDSDNPYTIEEILYTTLQKEGFITKDQRPDNTAFRVKEATTEERGDFIDYTGSALGDNSDRSPGEHAHYPLSWK